MRIRRVVFGVWAAFLWSGLGFAGGDAPYAKVSVTLEMFCQRLLAKPDPATGSAGGTEITYLVTNLDASVSFKAEGNNSPEGPFKHKFDPRLRSENTPSKLSPFKIVLGYEDDIGPWLQFLPNGDNIPLLPPRIRIHYISDQLEVRQGR